MSDQPNGNSREKEALMFTEFCRPAQADREATIHYTLRADTDAEILDRLSVLIQTFESMGFVWMDSLGTSRKFSGGGRGGGGGGQGTRDVPPEGFVATKFAVVAIPQKADQTKFSNKFLWFSDDMTMRAEEFGADWPKSGKAFAMGLIPDQTKVRVHSKGENIDPARVYLIADVFENPPAQLVVKATKGKYGWDVLSYEKR